MDPSGWRIWRAVITLRSLPIVAWMPDAFDSSGIHPQDPPAMTLQRPSICGHQRTTMAWSRAFGCDYQRPQMILEVKGWAVGSKSEVVF